jgi:hypothetical protein
MLEKPNMVMPALYGGIIIGVISGIPFLNWINCCCCAGILLGGALSVFFYKNDLTEGMPLLTSGDAIQLGALAGVFGAVVGTILTAAFVSTIGNVSGEAMIDFMDRFRDSVPPGTLEQMEDSLREGDLSPVGIVMTFVVDTVFGLLGGLIGYALFKPKPRMLNTEQQQPPPALPPQA